MPLQKKKPFVPSLGPVRTAVPPAGILRSREQGNIVNVIEPVNFRSTAPGRIQKRSRSHCTQSVAIDKVSTRKNPAKRRSRNIGQFFTDLADVKKKVDERLTTFLEDLLAEKPSSTITTLASIAEDFLEKKASQIWLV